MGRLVFLLTSPRVAPGLLTDSAWRIVRAADRVMCADAQLPLRQAVLQTEIPVEVVPAGSDVDRLRWALAAAEQADVVWLAAEDGDPGLAAGLAAEVVRRAEGGEDGPEIEVTTGSYDLPGARLLDLVAVMDRLRTSCPWDQQQTHRSLASYLVEETYEALEAVESGNLEHLREELGDLLLQVVFHARIAQENAQSAWDIDDVAHGIVAKLIRRHPHVFGDVSVTGAEQVKANWDTLKAAEKSRTSALEGIPMAMPALTLAAKVLERAHRAGFADQLVEPPGSVAAGTPSTVGEQLLGIVIAARHRGIDPEQALRDTLRDLAERVRAAEARR